jgi:hypothetical protein
MYLPVPGGVLSREGKEEIMQTFIEVKASEWWVGGRFPLLGGYLKDAVVREYVCQQ